jgi:hypothetical protein
MPVNTLISFSPGFFPFHNTSSSTSEPEGDPMPAEENRIRKLKAFLSDDVKVHRRMIGEDQVGTYQTLTVDLELIGSIVSAA